MCTVVQNRLSAFNKPCRSKRRREDQALVEAWRGQIHILLLSYIHVLHKDSGVFYSVHCWKKLFSSSFLVFWSFFFTHSFAFHFFCLCCVLRDDPRLFCHWKFIDEKEKFAPGQSSTYMLYVWFWYACTIIFLLPFLDCVVACWSSSITTSSHSHYCTSHHPSPLQGIFQEQEVEGQARPKKTIWYY